MILDALFILLLITYTTLKSNRELQYLQQSSYYNGRYLRVVTKNWIKRFYLYDYLAWIPLAIISLIYIHPVFFRFLWSLICIIAILKILRYKSIKPLVYTSRAKRLIITHILAKIALMTLCYYLIDNPIVVLIVSHSIDLFTPIILIVSNFCIYPLEKYIQYSYYRDASKKLMKLNISKIIGITGSYGKTSTKHFLNTIMSSKYNTLMTPASYNTLMGVVKTIREHLSFCHDVFIVEMGAKKKNDIQAIADLVYPHIGIITSIGPQHLETFKTMNNIMSTKFELAYSLRQSGHIVLNMDSPYVKDAKLPSYITPIYYSIKDKNADFYACNSVYNHEGMIFKICYDSIQSHSIETSLLGKHNLSNILASFCVANLCGLKEKEIIYGIRRLKPPKHRLELKKISNDVTIIDDSYNSNPEGASMALEVLSKIPGNKKIIITPGMIELGYKEHYYNKKLGQEIASCCEKVILVGKKQALYVHEGIKESTNSMNFDICKDLYLADNLKEANNYLSSIIESGDVVLYENDLPDVCY